MRNYVISHVSLIHKIIHDMSFISFFENVNLLYHSLLFLFKFKPSYYFTIFKNSVSQPLDACEKHLESLKKKWEKGRYPKWFQDISWQYVFVERRMDCQALKTLLRRFKKILTVVTLVCEHFLIFDKHMQFYHHNYQKKKYDSYLMFSSCKWWVMK